jgi:hypothetical protein
MRRWIGIRREEEDWEGGRGGKEDGLEEYSIR